MPLILAFIDGLGFNQIDFKSMPFLATLAQESNFGQLVPILGYSSAIQASLVTGVYPQEHGLWFHYFYNPSASPFKVASYLSLDRYWKACPPKLLMGQRALIRKSLGIAFGQRYRGYWGFTVPDSLPAKYLPFFDIAETRLLYDRNCLNRPTIFDFMYSCNMKFQYIFQTPTKTRIPPNWLDSENELYYLHFSVDEANHYYGPQRTETRNFMKLVDRSMADFFRKIKKTHNDYRFVVFSDHGHSWIKNRFNLQKELQDIVGTYRIVSFLDATIARFWCPHGGRERIEERLSSFNWGFLLDRQLKKKYGVNFKDNRYGEVIFVSKNGTVLEPNSWGSQLGLRKQVSTHGYDPFHEETLGIFVSDLTKMKRLNAVDIMPLARICLGI